jgi:hypothetical protein
VCIEGSSVRRRSEHFIRTGRGGFIVAHHSGVAQGRGVDRDSRDLCLDGLGKKKASDEKKQGKMRLCNGNSLDEKILSRLKRDHDCKYKPQCQQRFKKPDWSYLSALESRFMFPSIAPKSAC